MDLGRTIGSLLDSSHAEGLANLQLDINFHLTTRISSLRLFIQALLPLSNSFHLVREQRPDEIRRHFLLLDAEASRTVFEHRHMVPPSIVSLQTSLARSQLTAHKHNAQSTQGKCSRQALQEQDA